MESKNNLLVLRSLWRQTGMTEWVSVKSAPLLEGILSGTHSQEVWTNTCSICRNCKVIVYSDCLNQKKILKESCSFHSPQNREKSTVYKEDHECTKTCEFRHFYFGSSIILPCQIKFLFKTYQWLQDIQESFLDMNLTGKHFFSGSKQPLNGKNGQFESKLSTNG